MAKSELNNNDKKLLGFCFNRKRHLSEIARTIGIDVKNVSVRIPFLEESGLIEVEIIGNKKYIRTKQGDKTKKYLYEILKQLESHKGELKYDDYMALIPYDPSNLDADRYSAPLKLLWLQPKMVEQYIKITEEGRRFLQENSKKLDNSIK